MKERRLIQKAKNGDREALEELISMYYQQIYKYFVRTIGHTNTATALDLTQDTFLRMVQALPYYQPYKDFCAWIYTIAHHIALDHFKKKKDILLESEYPFELQKAPLTEKDENYYHIQAILKQLPQKQREAIILYYYQGLNYRQIASVLSIPISTVKTRVRTGIQRCRNLWEDTQ